MSKKRDYAAEYKRRIDRLTAAGFSKTQARGHVKTKVIDDGKGGQRRINLERTVTVENIRAKVQTARDKAFGGNPPERRQRGETKTAYEDRIATARAESIVNRVTGTVAEMVEDIADSAIDFLEDIGEAFEGHDYDADYEAASDEVDYSWDDMDSFLEEMRDEGLSEHDAHDLWFGY